MNLPIPSASSPADLARQLSPQQFELLVRQYISQQLRLLVKRRSPLMLMVSMDYNNSQIETCEWKLGAGYSSDPQTSGEILAEVIQEQNRREGFQQQCKLLSIEHQPAVPGAGLEAKSAHPSPLGDDEIPF